MEGDQTQNPKNTTPNAGPSIAPAKSTPPAQNPQSAPALDHAQNLAVQPQTVQAASVAPTNQIAPNTQQATPAVSPATTNPSATHPSSVDFKSSDIGVKTVVKEDPFAPQNQRAAAKKQQAKKDRKKLYLIGGIIAAVAVLALVIVGLVIIFSQTSNPESAGQPELPADEQPAPDRTISVKAEDVSNLAEEAYQEDGANPEAAESVFNEAIKDATDSGRSEAENQAYINQVQLAKVMFYINNGYYNNVIETESQVKPETMTLDQRSAYYNMLYLAYLKNGGYPDKVEEYSKLMYEAAQEAGGYGDGGE